MFHKPKSAVCKDGKVRGTGRKLREAKCLTPDCENMFGGTQEKPGGRGLCCVCHSVASRLVKQKKTTWEELEQLNLALPKVGSRFELAMVRAKKEKELKEKGFQDSVIKEQSEEI